MPDTLLTLFSEPQDLLALEPEELAGVLVELVSGVPQSRGFSMMLFHTQVFPPLRTGYQSEAENVLLALAEAFSWLEMQGIVARDPNWNVHSDFSRLYFLTRRGRQLRSRADVETYRRGRMLPLDLLQPALADKVHHLFLRGDYDTAVFQAFKEVEVAVRTAGGYGADTFGVDLMRKAFHAENGPLCDNELLEAERQAEMFLFSGAIGHAKNPASHRVVGLERVEAARLIVFASHLLDIVEQRAQQPQP